MTIDIKFPEAIKVPREVPIYQAVPPAWTPEKVAKLAASLDLKGDVTDAGAWFVCRDARWALEVYQASHSLRLERIDFDAEGRGADVGKPPERDRALAVAKRFLDTVGPGFGTPDLDSVTELRVMQASRDGKGTARVVGLQANFRYAVDGLALVGPGAKAQVSVGHDGELAQAYRFSRELKKVDARPTIQPAAAFAQFAASERFADLGRGAKVRVTSAQLGLLSLPPTEVQSVLTPSYVLRGEVSTELQPHYEFIAYVAAVDLNEAEAKRKGWAHPRPALLMN